MDAVVSDIVLGLMLSGVHADICVKPLQLLGSLFVQTFSCFVSSPVELLQQPSCLSPRQLIWLIRKSIFRSILNGWSAYSCALLHPVAEVHKHVDVGGGGGC